MKPQDDLANEDPDLLNPRVDHPEEHFRFDFMGGIHARRESRRGEVSIRVYSLDHPWLVEARLKHFTKHLRPIAERWLENPDDPKTLAHVDALTADDALYAQLARQVFDDPLSFGL